MIDAAQQAASLIVDYFLDGFLALVAVAVAGPLLGVLLVLRRMPLLGLAIPEMAGCGQAAAFFGFALLVALDPSRPEEPGTVVQLGGALLGVLVGLGALLWCTRDRRFLGVHAGVVFLVAIGLREILYLESPYEQIFEEAAIHHGRLLTVGPGGRNLVVGCCAMVVAAVSALWRRLWLSAFDADQARLLGMSPERHTAATLLLLGGLSALCVPVVGPEVVLTLLLVPAAVLRPFARSLSAYAPLSVLAGVVGSVIAFALACSEGIDWPPGPALVLCVLATSLGLVGVLALAGLVRGTRIASLP